MFFFFSGSNLLGRFRFPATFHPRSTAQELKALCEEKIEMGLKAVRFTRKKKPVRGARADNDVTEPLDDRSIANLEDERIEPEDAPQAPSGRAFEGLIMDGPQPSHGTSPQATSV